MKQIFSALCNFSRAPIHSKGRRSYAAALLTAVAVLLMSCTQPHEFAGPELSAPHPVPEQALMSADGPVSLQDFEGQYLFVYFGYTFCPDVCPLTMATLAQVRAALAEDADRIQVIMVSVDPERDTPETLERYMSYFHDSFIGITGSEEAIRAVSDPFGVYFAKGEGSAATGYLVDHTARVYLVDPMGNARVAYPHSITAEEILSDLRYLFRGRS